jgi:hypothetical protein
MRRFYKDKGTKKEEVTEKYRILHNEKLSDKETERNM